MSYRILIIEDEPSILMGLEDDLISEGYEVNSCMNGKEGFQQALKQESDLILLDIMLPGMNGLDICKELRKRDIKTPIIMLTAKSQEIDKVLGLEFGADDYVTKPFSLRELQARIKAVMRRIGSSEHHTPKKLDLNFLQIDESRNEAYLHGNLLDLTHLEFKLLQFLASQTGTVIDRYKILEEVWNEDVMVTSRTVDTHVANLRKKLDEEKQDKSWIIGVRGVGYKLMIPRFNKS